jgi:hypothetical protein
MCDAAEGNCQRLRHFVQLRSLLTLIEHKLSAVRESMIAGNFGKMSKDREIYALKNNSSLTYVEHFQKHFFLHAFSQRLRTKRLLFFRLYDGATIDIVNVTFCVYVCFTFT